jgi:DNA-binding NarL/FixJ family response regulator
VDEGAHTRLLIVEDHQLLAGALAMALRGRGLDVTVAAGPSPGEVVDQARGLAPVLVLLDLELGTPLGSGTDLVGPLRDAGATVVMMTGVTDRARLAACVEAGAVGVIGKAAPFEELVATVQRVSGGEALLGQEERAALLAELRSRQESERERYAPFASLTAREQAVLAALVEGQSAEAIAAGAYVSIATVRSQIQAILRKLGVASQLAAVAKARQAGWPPEHPG